MIRVPTYDEIATYLRALPEAERHAAALRYKHELGLDPRKLLSAAAAPLPVEGEPEARPCPRCSGRGYLRHPTNAPEVRGTFACPECQTSGVAARRVK